MSISQLFADSALVRLLRGKTAPREMLLAMTGVTLGERLLVLGLADASVLPILATKVGITGHACGADPEPDAVEQTRRQAVREGVLVELEQSGYGNLPYDKGSFDVVVIRTLRLLADEAALTTSIHASYRLLRDGGRCIAVSDTQPTGIRRLANRIAGPAPNALLAQFAAAGYRGGRLLVEREGLSFVEAIRRASA